MAKRKSATRRSKADQKIGLTRQRPLKVPAKKIVAGSSPSRPSFPIVGVGASAGGLEAFMEVFRGLPPSTGMAFVLIQHLAPSHLSSLTLFIQKVTQMEVSEVEDGDRVEANHVYVIPPNTILEIFHGVLHLRPIPAPHASTLPVDAFLTSLARDHGNLAIGVILSGTGSDGSLGLKEIKADGGITIVQKPETAKYDGMPSAAIRASLPDHVLTVPQIAQKLVKIAAHPNAKRKTHQEVEEFPNDEDEAILQKIFIIVRNKTKIDFSTYKCPTIIRRIKRRMALHRVETVKHYLKYLQTTPPEVDALFEDLLINVTTFFRDAEPFEALKSKVFSTLIEGRAPGTPIRVWVPGCATGEEVYSIAISILEYLGGHATTFPIQIYGSDICEAAITIARKGIYPENSLKNLSAERLERFFKLEPGGYRISKVVRDCCIFSIQDVTSQPPINRLDLLSCRNLLIYLSVPIQKKLMETFFYALNSNGFLLLGTSESVGTAADLFGVFDKKNKIYSKKSALGPSRLESPAFVPPSTVQASKPEIVVRPLRVSNLVADAERLVLERFAPAWVLVNSKLDVVQFRGATGRYMEPPSGQPTWNLIRILRDGLSMEVGILIRSALKEEKSIRKEGISVRFGGLKLTVDIEVVPMAPDHCIVLFFERSIINIKEKDLAGASKRKKKKLSPGDLEISSLKSELVATQKSMQMVIEDQNMTNEEMQSVNEEVLSANEELQSTNEELETAKEELQSTNEELTSLNDELSSRNQELDHLNDDLLNVLNNANVSIVMLDTDLKIRRFTPMAEKLLKLIGSDLGRNFTDINIGFPIDKIEEKIEEVIRSMSTLEFETPGPKGSWYSIRIRPYKTSDNRIDGAVLAFVNIDEAKTLENVNQETQAYSDGIIQTVRDPLIVLDEKFQVERANHAFFETFKLKPDETIGKKFYEIGDGNWNSPELRSLLEEILPEKKEVYNFHVRKWFSDVGEKSILLNARTLKWAGQVKLLILVSLHDLTEHEAQ